MKTIVSAVIVSLFLTLAVLVTPSCSNTNSATDSIDSVQVDTIGTVTPTIVVSAGQ